MNRRGFLGLLAASAVVPILPEPTSRTIFLPPRGGWVGGGFLTMREANLTPANLLLTPAMISREALKIFRVEMEFSALVEREYDPRFAAGDRVGTINIARPERYGLRVGDLITIEGVHA